MAVVYYGGGAFPSLFAAGSVSFSCQCPFRESSPAVHAAPRRAPLGVRVASLRGRMGTSGAQKLKSIAATLPLRFA